MLQRYELVLDYQNTFNNLTNNGINIVVYPYKPNNNFFFIFFIAFG